MKGAGSGPPVWKSDPCADPTLKATVHDHNGDHVFIGGDGPDVIFGSEGHDVIWGNGGNDIICARGGDDEIHGGAGDDYIDGGSGNDTIDAGDGDDLVHGRAGGDDIHGGKGDDILFGDILDDTLWGDEGDDLLIGGHGTDVMHGGTGNDYFRGDTGNDSFFGDDGHDVVSFMTSMPPGDPEHGYPGNSVGIDGVIVNMNDPCIGDDGIKHDGCAFGDGKGEPLDSIEAVIGSPYDDHFINAKSGTIFYGGLGNDRFDVANKNDAVDGGGNDTCNGHPCGTSSFTPPNGKVYVFVSGHERDLGVVIMGTAGDDQLTIHPDSGKLVVDATAPTNVAAGAGCHQIKATKVVCDIQSTLRFVAAYGDDGNDTMTFQGNFPRDFTAHANGGRGNDTLVGGAEQDVFFTGVTGTDLLQGGPGDDALLSESELEYNQHKPQVANYPDGADTLEGGEGDDQLVADYPCGGHHYSGGPGLDIAGFARSGSPRIFAQLAQAGDNPSVKTNFYGYAYNPDLCSDPTKGTKLAPDLEVLEAAAGDDDLWGNDHDNTIWGRIGNDTIHGLGGDDDISGLDGNDTLYGGPGHDKIEGGAGNDTIYAGDGEADKIFCGPGKTNLVSRDPSDQLVGCH